MGNINLVEDDSFKSITSTWKDQTNQKSMYSEYIVEQVEISAFENKIVET